MWFASFSIQIIQVSQDVYLFIIVSRDKGNYLVKLTKTKYFDISSTSLKIAFSFRVFHAILYKLFFVSEFSEQYESFVKFTQDQIMRRYGARPASCKRHDL